MSHARDKAQAFTKQLVGGMIGDDLLVQEGKEQEREADRAPSKTEKVEEQAQKQAKGAERRPARKQQSDKR